MSDFRVLLATEKAFGSSAVQAIEATLAATPGFRLTKLENYTSREEFLNLASEAEAVIVRSDKCDAEFFSRAKNLKLLVRAGAGVDTIDLAAARERGVVVQNTPGMNSNAVAELVFGMLLFHLRTHFNGDLGSELRGRRLGLHGCGNVSRFVIQVARGFGFASIIAYDPFLGRAKIEELGVQCAETLDELFTNSDIVSLHIPLTPETNQSINRNFLTKMPKGGILVNTARQEVIHEGDLLEVLTEHRRDLSYLADVQPGNLAALKATLAEKFDKQVFVTPKKLGAQTIEANNNCAPAAARQIVGFFTKNENKFQVN